jgi:hypothetical protein
VSDIAETDALGGCCSKNRNDNKEFSLKKFTI